MKNVYLYLGALVLAISAGNALGQRPGGNGPLPGDPGYGGGGGQYAMPPAPPQPTGEWIKTWGSIAIPQSGKSGAGATTGMLSKLDAENEAKKRCEKLALGVCKTMISYINQCVAFAWKAEGIGVGASVTGASIKSASDRAINRCSGLNDGASCNVIYLACSESIFKSYN